MILSESVPVMIESKETPKWTPAGFIHEMEAQILHAGAEFGFVMVKKRGTTDVGKYYALTTCEQMMSLIERVWEIPPPPPKRRLVIGPRLKRVLRRAT